MLKSRLTSLSRREFLAAASVAGGVVLLPPGWLYAFADEADPHVATVLSRTIGIDMHNHVYTAGTEPHPNFGPPPGAKSGPNQGGPNQGGPPQQQHQDEKPGPELLLAGHSQ